MGPIKNKKIFITGGAGFIANILISRLIDHNQIVVYDNFARDTLSNSPYAQHENLAVIRRDILEYEMLLKNMGRSDIVIHAAAIAGIDTVKKDPVKTMRVNMLGTANVLEAARHNNIRERIITFSTSEVFGPIAFKSTENDNTVTGSAGEARWVYAVSKLAGEHLAKAYYQKYHLPVVIVRPFNIYGPGQTGEGALSIFIQRALRNDDLHIDGDGSQIRAWCYVEDFVDCLMRCLENPKAVGESFNIGNTRAIITVLGLAETICRVLNSKSKIVFDPPLSADIELRIPSVEKAQRILGFKAKVDLEEGIKKTAEWYLNNPEILKRKKSSP